MINIMLLRQWDQNKPLNYDPTVPIYQRPSVSTAGTKLTDRLWSIGPHLSAPLCFNSGAKTELHIIIQRSPFISTPLFWQRDQNWPVDYNSTVPNNQMPHYFDSEAKTDRWITIQWSPMFKCPIVSIVGTKLTAGLWTNGPKWSNVPLSNDQMPHCFDSGAKTDR